MTESGRPAIFLFCSVLAVTLASCGGGGGSGSTPSHPTPTPTGGPATPTPTPVPSVAVSTRPLANGDSFTYAGQTQQSFVYEGASPSPAASSIASVTQTVAVTAPAAFNSVSGLSNFVTQETDTTPLQTTTITTDTYYAEVASGASTNLVDYGYSSSDNFGESLVVQYGSSGGAVPRIIDELPEVPGASWGNNAAESLNETSPGNQTSVRTVNADGSYTDTTTYPSGSPFTPAPAPVTATIVENSNGSGSYSFPLGGPPNTVVTLGSPQPAPASVIPITIAQPGFAPITGTVPVWFPVPLVLHTETDTNDGAQNIPAGCNVPSSLGQTANAIVQTATTTDTILGTIETLLQTEYVVPTNGVACVVLDDVLTSYYDYSGQSVDIINFSNTPLETTTVATTLGLTEASVSSRLRAAQVRAAGFRIASARANFVATVERIKLEHERRLLTHLHRAISERQHR
jgi:hypothetical protein